MATLCRGPEELLAIGVLGRAAVHRLPFRVPSRPSTPRHETDGDKSSPGSVRPGAEVEARLASRSPGKGEHAVGYSAQKGQEFPSTTCSRKSGPALPVSLQSECSYNSTTSNSNAYTFNLNIHN